MMTKRFICCSSGVYIFGMDALAGVVNFYLHSHGKRNPNQNPSKAMT